MDILTIQLIKEERPLRIPDQKKRRREFRTLKPTV